MIGFDARDVHGELLWTREFKPSPVPTGWRMVKDGLDGAAYTHRDGLQAILSGNREADGKRWLHLSVSKHNRLPYWEELRTARVAFLGEERPAYLVFPPKDTYVNIHKFCLHLWSCLDGEPLLPEFSGVVGGRRTV